MPNLARDPESIRRNAAAVSALLEKRGVKTRLLEVPGAPPVVFGEIRTPGATRTMIFYAHYDGQPLDPKEWATPPWQPVLRNRPLGQGRPCDPAAAAGRSIPNGGSTPGRPPTTRRPSSPSRRRSMRSRPPRFRCTPTSSSSSKARKRRVRRTWRRSSRSTRTCWRGDVWLICDGPLHQSRRQQIVFGARGITDSTSRSTDRVTNCTAGTTATGRRIPR